MQTNREKKLEFADRAVQIVERTAMFGLEQSRQSPELFEKWLLIWACEVAGELGEVFDADTEEAETLECGDVIWGMTALCLLLDIRPEDIFQFNHITYINDAEVVLQSLKLVDHCKKVCRDGQAVRQIDRKEIAKWMREVFCWISREYNPFEALSAVNEKLLKRYPNGYSPQASANRLI